MFHVNHQGIKRSLISCGRQYHPAEIQVRGQK